jgi:hypothetical protein
LKRNPQQGLLTAVVLVLACLCGLRNHSISAVNNGKCYCSRKGKFDFNLQAICDIHRRLFNISIGFPSNISHHVAWVGNGFKSIIEKEGILAALLYLFGENAHSYSIPKCKG